MHQKQYFGPFATDTAIGSEPLSVSVPDGKSLWKTSSYLVANKRLPGLLTDGACWTREAKVQGCTYQPRSARRARRGLARLCSADAMDSAQQKKSECRRTYDLQ